MPRDGPCGQHLSEDRSGESAASSAHGVRTWSRVKLRSQSCRRSRADASLDGCAVLGAARRRRGLAGGCWCGAHREQRPLYRPATLAESSGYGRKRAVRLRTPFKGVRANCHVAGYERRPLAGGICRDRHGSGTRASYRDVLAACPSKWAAAGGRREIAVCLRRTRCGRRIGSRAVGALARRGRRAAGTRLSGRSRGGGRGAR